MDSISAVPRQQFLGVLADTLQGANNWLTSPQRTQQLQGLSGLLGLASHAKTLDRMSYGEPLTNIGKANVPLLPTETADSLMAVAGLASPAANAVNSGAAFVGRKVAPAVERMVPQILDRGGMTADILRGMADGTQSAVRPTVKAQRIAYPGIYGNPREMVAEAASRVAPEDAALKQIFGVTRDDLWEIGQHGTRQGSLLNVPYKTSANPRGAQASLDVMNNRNAGRIQDIISEAMERPELYRPMASWYVNDPLFDQFKRLHGDKAAEEFNRFNALTGMASPGSEVLTELNRGTAANWLAKEGRWDDFMKYGGYGNDRRAADATFPEDMRGVMGHPYHSTAQAPAMDKYIKQGRVDMGSAKVPSYIEASGTPEVGFQTDFPVADAHFSRLVGLADTRNPKFVKGKEVVPKQSASVSEVATLTPWWRDEVADPMGLKAVPAQAVVWGAGSGATGVTSPIGAPKLELLAQQIMKTAQRLGISPEEARDMVLTGKTYAGDGVGGLASLLDD